MQVSQWANANEMRKYILKFMIDNPKNARQVRALFTAWCILFDVMPDTAQCDYMLEKMYALIDEGNTDKEFFDGYMLEDLV